MEIGALVEEYIQAAQTLRVLPGMRQEIGKKPWLSAHAVWYLDREDERCQEALFNLHGDLKFEQDEVNKYLEENSDRKLNFEEAERTHQERKKQYLGALTDEFIRVAQVLDSEHKIRAKKGGTMSAKERRSDREIGLLFKKLNENRGEVREGLADDRREKFKAALNTYWHVSA